MIIDFHTHNFPDKLAARAIAGMMAKLNGSLTPVGDGTLARQLGDMALCGVDQAVMCPVATRPEQAEVIIRRACAIMSGEHGEAAAKKIIPFASLHPSDALLLRHIDQVLAAGLKGVKLHPYYQRFALQDPMVVPFMRSLRDAGLVVVCHCGQDPGYLADAIECGPKEIASLMKAVPGLAPKFVAAHLGGFAGAPAHAVDCLLDCGVWFDTAVLKTDQVCDEPRRIMREWPAERLLFGSDYYWTSQRELIDWVRECRPVEDDLQKIFHLNAKRLLSLS